MKTLLANKLLTWFVLLSVVPLIIFSVYSYTNNTKELIKTSIEKLKSSSRLQKKFIQNWFSYRKSDIESWSESTHNIHFLEDLIVLNEKNNISKNRLISTYNYVKTVDKYEYDLVSLKRHYSYIYDLFLIDKNGNILYSIAKENDLGTNLFDGVYSNSKFASAYKSTLEDKQIHFSDLEFYSPSQEAIAGFITSPLVGDDGSFIGVLAMQFHWDAFNNIFTTQENYTHYLVGLDGILRTDINNEKRALDFKVDLSSLDSDFRVVEKIMIYDKEWILVNEFDENILKKNKQDFASSLLLILVIVFILVIIVSRYLSLAITKALSRLVKASQDYVNGSRRHIQNDSKDKEIYELTLAFNKMLSSLSENENMLKEYTLELENRIEKELEKNTLQQKRLFDQTRLAQMGEMISMIAHQWRQPLGAISAANIDLKMKLELEIFDLETEEGREGCVIYFGENLNKVEELVKNLTATIDDFRNFYKPNKIRNTVNVNKPIEKALAIIEATLYNEHISIEKELLSQKKLEILDGEVMQVFLNIFKNSQDNFQSKNIKNPYIYVSTKDTEKGVIIQIRDNGGGIPEDIMNKIFDPYFSTKMEKNGTGLGLYMSKTIIEDYHLGTLYAINISNGVEFKIEIIDAKYEEVSEKIT